MKKNIENSDMPISSPTMLAPRRVRSRKIENGTSGSLLAQLDDDEGDQQQRRPRSGRRSFGSLPSRR